VGVTLEQTEARNAFRIVLGTERPGIAAFVASLGARNSRDVTVTTFAFDEVSRASVSRAVMTASVVLIDASLDPSAGLDVCRQLRARRDSLRFGILFCCAHAARSDSMRPFLDEGIGSFIDLQLSPDQTVAALRSIARGEDVVRLDLSKDSSAELFNGQALDEQLSDADRVLMRLVALGFTDQQIGSEMSLSHHTIKHRIERLRARLNARNRIQLAAFAGRLEESQRADGVIAELEGRRARR
jgi:DNA-binding NarL/FixJ family response regulator